MFLNYLKNSIFNVGHYLSKRVLNYFFKKMIKQYSSNTKNIRLYINYNTKSHIIFTIANLDLINIYNKLFDKITIPKITILFGSGKSPEIITKITSIDIISNKYVLDFSNNDFIKNINIMAIPNLKTSMLSGLNKVDRIINKLTNKQIYIINCINLTNNDIMTKFDTVYIRSFGKTIVFKCNSCEFYYKNISLLKIKKIRFNYDGCKTIIYINKINSKINDTNNLIKELESIFKKYIIKFSDGNTSDITVKVGCIIIEIKNNNKLLLKLNKVEYEFNKIINIERIELISQYKSVALIDKLHYNLSNGTSEVNYIKLDLYKSLPHKLHIFFQKYILTKLNTNIIPEFIGIQNSLKYKYIDKAIFYNNNNLNMMGNNMTESIISSNYLDNSTQNIVDILVESYIMDSKGSDLDKKIKIDYINTISEYIKLKMYIKDITIKLIDNNDVCNIIKLDNNLYILDDLGKVFIKCVNIVACDKSNIPIIKRNNKSCPILEIIFLKDTISISLSNIYINLKIEEFKLIYNFIEIINKYLKLSIYVEDEMDYKKDNFIFNKVTIHPFKLVVFYYPDNCNYYKLFVGNIEELYKITNYENVNLNMNEITITHPYDFLEMMTTITTKWLDNIKNTQINNIIKGTKFKKANNIQNKLIYDIRKLIDISLKKLSGNSYIKV